MLIRRVSLFVLALLALASLAGCDANRLLGIPTFVITRVDAGAADDAGGLDAGDTGDSGVLDDATVSDAGRSDTGRDAGVDTEDDTFFEEPEVGPRPDVPTFEEPPIITAIYPAQGDTAGGDLVVMEGARFGADVEVLFDGVRALSVDLIDEFQLAATTPPGAAGVVSVKVTTEAGSAVAEDAFTYVAPLRITSIEPASGQVAGRYQVEVVGEGFARAPRVLFDEREALAVDVLSDTRLRVQVPAGARAGQVDVIAFDDTLARAEGAFTYVDRPALLAAVPSLGPAEGGTPVRLDGVGIDVDCVALFGGATVAVARDDEGWPSVVTPAGLPGPVNVSMDCGERGATILIDGFTYVAGGGIQLGTVWPSQGFTSGGAVVSVDGMGLADAESVTFGTASATIVRASDGVLDVLAPPAAAPGPVDVTVRVDGADFALEDGFLYTARPVFADVTPAQGPRAGGWTARISGEGFDGVDALLLDGREVPIEARTATSMAIAVPEGAGGPAPLRAQIGALIFDTGLIITRADDLRFDSIFPAVGSATGGTVVYVTGEGFDAGCVVLIDGVRTATTTRGAALLAAVTPAHEPGSATVQVEGCGDAETWRSPISFRYIDPTRVPGGVGGGALDGELRVSVIESNSDAPIEGATVMVRVRDTSPYVALTDVNGLATFVGEDLVGPQTVTAWADGRSAETYVNVDAADVTLVLAAIQTPCDPLTDPDCVPPPPLENGQIIGFLTGLGKVTDPPPGASLFAVVETTRLVPGYTNPDPGPNNTLTENGAFSLETRRGDLALLALCGYRFEESGQFVPLTMGVVRNIQMRPGEVFRTTIDCDTPLSEQLTIKLVNAPELSDVPDGSFPGTFRARLIFDFGGEGVFESLPRFEGDTRIFTGGAFPPLQGDLAGVRYDIVAGVYPDAGNIPYAETYLRRLSRFDDTAVMPRLLAVPEFVYPSAAEPYLTEGYVEWRYDTSFAVPDLYYITASSSAPSFPSWTLFVPGDQASFHFADFPEFSEIFGFIPGPGAPEGSLSLYVRAVDLDVFSFSDFTRYALRSANWNALSANYANFALRAPVEGEAPPDEGAE